MADLASVPAQPATADARNTRRRAILRLLRNRLAVTGLALMGLVVLVAVCAPVLTSHDPLLIRAELRLQPPSAEHLLGTDEFGRDVFSRVLHGARISLQVGVSVVLVVAAGGILIGTLAGYYRRIDNVLMRVMDGLMAFPGILLAIAIMASLGPRVSNVVIALSVVYVPRMARVVRSQVLLLRESLFVEAARAAGAPDWLILARHIVPNCLSATIVQGTVTFAYAVISEAALSFLGAGAPPELPTWGNMLAEGRNFVWKAPWLTIYPGLAIMVTVLGLNLFGDGLRDLLDPRVRGR